MPATEPTTPDTTEAEVVHFIHADTINPDHIPQYAKKTFAITAALECLDSIKPQEAIAVLCTAGEDLVSHGVDLAKFQNHIEKGNFPAAAQHYKTMMDLMGAQKFLYLIREARKQREVTNTHGTS